MISKDKLLKHPNYLMSKYQAEIYRQLTAFMSENNLSQKQIAERLGVSTSYVNQILKGNFNYTLKKLVEISLMMGKVPAIEFVSFGEYWNLQKGRLGVERTGIKVRSTTDSRSVARAGRGG